MTSSVSGTYLNISALVQQAIYTKTKALSSDQTQVSSLNSQISTMGKIKSSISTLNDSIANIKDSFNSFLYDNIPDGVTFNKSETGSYNIEVKQLAKAQISTINKAYNTDALGYSGDLTINLGTYNNDTLSNDKSISVTIDPTDTLSNVKDKINNLNIDVKATIIHGNNGDYLSYSNTKKGDNAAFEITANSSSLDQLTVKKNQTNFLNVSDAMSGVAIISGIEVKSNDNVFNVNDNVQFTAKKTFAATKVGIDQDTSKIKDAINSFVSKYNQLTTDLKNTNIKDNQITNFLNNFRNIITKADGGSSMLNIGLSYDKSGSLSFDATKFTNNASNITSLKNKLTDNKDVSNYFDKYLGFFGVIKNNTDSYSNKVTKLNSEISKLNNDVDKQTTYYTNKYAQLDSYLGTLNGNLSSVSNLIK